MDKKFISQQKPFFCCISAYIPKCKICNLFWNNYVSLRINFKYVSHKFTNYIITNYGRFKCLTHKKIQKNRVFHDRIE